MEYYYKLALGNRAYYVDTNTAPDPSVICGGKPCSECRGGTLTQITAEAFDKAVRVERARVALELGPAPGLRLA